MRAFAFCKQLRRIEISKESMLQIIEEFAFAKSSIESITIPREVINIKKCAFSCCSQLQIIEIDENSKLVSIDQDWLHETKNAILMIPSNKRNLL